MAKDLSRILVVDLEATCWRTPEERPAGERHEIIEIGYAEMTRDPKTREWSTLPGASILVLPEQSTVSDFCTELTGHTQGDLLRRGFPYRMALAELRRRFPKLHLVPWASWGDYDREMLRAAGEKHLHYLSVEARKEYLEAAARDPFPSLPLEAYPFSRTHFNLKSLFALLTGAKKELDLPAALQLVGLSFEGAPHRGDIDAYNTARLFCAMLNSAARTSYGLGGKPSVRSVCLLIENADGLLAGLRSSKHEGRPELPGGKLEADETWEDAAKREGLEELGIPITNLRVVCRFPVGIPNGDAHDCVAFAAELLEPSKGLGAGNEGPTAWLTRKEILDHGTYRHTAPKLFAAYDSSRFPELSGK